MTIQMYLVVVQHTQIVHGLPEPRESSALPHCIWFRTEYTGNAPPQAQPPWECLPLTPPLLQPICLHRHLATYEESLVWVVSSVCFFGFFIAGEITVPSVGAYDRAVHLSWGNICISQNRRVLQVFLKWSKRDQYGRGVEVFIGATDDNLCSVRAVHLYTSMHGTGAGALFFLLPKTHH